MPTKYYFEWEMIGEIRRCLLVLFIYPFRGRRGKIRDIFTRSPYISGECITFLAGRAPRWKALFVPTGALLLVNRFYLETWITGSKTPVLGKGKHNNTACCELLRRLFDSTICICSDHRLYLFIRSDSWLVGIYNSLFSCIRWILVAVSCVLIAVL